LQVLQPGVFAAQRVHTVGTRCFPNGRVLLLAAAMLATACSPTDARNTAMQSVAYASSVVTAPSAFVQQRDINVSELPFPDNPDPNQCGIPTLWGGGAGWLDGTYASKLIEPTVLLYNSHERIACDRRRAKRNRSAG
jgi:hypothetical protein